MKIQILVDNSNSWIIPYSKELQKKLLRMNHDVSLIFNHENILQGDVLILLSCEKILKNLSLNSHNIVVHESDLPKGKGWSPLTWQILEGKNKIPITLFEANENIDDGIIYLKDEIILNGTELLPEIKRKQGEKTIEMILEFIKNINSIKGKKQKGTSTYYKKRTPKDSELDINKTIDSQFNKFRVCDNERYPAFFIKNGVKYYLKISKDKTN